jgi:SAM-dependent methyltransferase
MSINGLFDEYAKGYYSSIPCTPEKVKKEDEKNVLFTFCGKAITPQILKQEPWLKYLFITNNNAYNIERVDSFQSVQKNETLNYVERTLQNLNFKGLSKMKYRLALIRTLEWCEVAKCGTQKMRNEWEATGLSLDIHNEASAEIYLRESTDDLWTTRVVYTLIKTHGLLGQYIRGEVNLSQNADLLFLMTSKIIDGISLKNMLMSLNEAIISSVSKDIWEEVKSSIDRITTMICIKRNTTVEFSYIDRLKKMFPTAFSDTKELSKDEQKLCASIFPYCDFWYPQVALDSFNKDEIFTIFKLISKCDLRLVKHISFYPLSQSLFYDYECKKKVNVYKKRIIEMRLKELSENDESKSEHVDFSCTIKGNSLYFDVVFTDVCSSLIEFCIQAERSGMMKYQKNITPIFDLFGFRRDIFDRLNNEEKYLDTMNDVDESRKEEILDYVIGGRIVDVGSGGGVLLDALEKKFPTRTIIGTDISQNVIETLQSKIKNENHNYTVTKHNFVTESLDEDVDTIIFSSILHEIFSYTEYQGKKFNIESIRAALINAFHSLAYGGRIVIRDGVKTASDKDVTIRFLNDDGMKFFRNYCIDFKGLPDVERKFVVDEKERTVTGNINFIRELLYTYTWGNESYSCEVNEQFGYLTLNEYKELFISLGFKIEVAEEYLENGYPEHLNPLVQLCDFTWEDIPSNCIIVAFR